MTPPTTAEITEFFHGVHEDVFAGDPAANEALAVEVVTNTSVVDVTIAVVITPWTISGLLFGDTALPDTLVVGRVARPVIPMDTEALGAYRTVPLLGELAGIVTQDEARTIASTLGADLVRAVERACDAERVDDPDRRAMFRSVVRPADGPAG